MPADHGERTDATCLGCHVPAESPLAPLPADERSPQGALVTNEYCLACHSNPSLTMKLPSGEEVKLFIDRATYKKAVHGRRGMSCSACHQDMNSYPHPKGHAKTPRELNRGIVQKACGACHEEIFRKYGQSVHGKALLEEGNVDVPSCTDCHGVHGSLRDPHQVLFRLESPDTCSTCHSDPKRMAPYKLSPDVAKTYFSDFHGASLRLERNRDGNQKSFKPVCYDCHGIHDIKKVSDPSSSVVRENLVRTCKNCHKEAEVNFPSSWTSHYVPDKNKWPLVFYINLFYKVMIPTILGAMGLYIVLELSRNLIDWRRRRKGRTP